MKKTKICKLLLICGLAFGANAAIAGPETSPRPGPETSPYVISGPETSPYVVSGPETSPKSSGPETSPVFRPASSTHALLLYIPGFGHIALF